MLHLFISPDYVGCIARLTDVCVDGLVPSRKIVAAGVSLPLSQLAGALV